MRFLRNTLAVSLLSVALLSGGAVFAAAYDVDYTASKIDVRAEHAGKPFTGTFGEWTAEINFDTDDLPASKITAVLEAASFKTGDKIYDGTVHKADWFNSKAFPEIKFESEQITAIDAASGEYKAEGHISIKSLNVPYSFIFTLSDPTQNPVHAKATLSLDRLALGLGATSDPKAEWVSKDVTMVLDITASAL